MNDWRSIFPESGPWGGILRGLFYSYREQHRARVSRARMEFPLEIYQHPEHAGLRREGGRNAALLVHGFPGSPIEMRWLADELHTQGWTVEAPLLPGFGPEILELGERRWEDWQQTVTGALERLKRDYERVLLVGLSMGGALSVRAAAACPPDGLVLLAPFSGLILPLRQALYAGQWLFPPAPQLLRYWEWLDFPQVRKDVENFLPGVEWDRPELRAALREMRFPLRTLVQIQRAGQTAVRAAPLVRTPTLIVQGNLDVVVLPVTTRRLAARLPQVERYLEVTAAHDLLYVNRPAWPQVRQSVVEFARGIQ